MADGQPREMIALGPSAPAPLTPMEMVGKLIEQGGDVEVMSKMLDLQERWQANEDRRAFNEAIAAVRSELPVVVKDREVDFTHNGKRTHYRFEDLASIQRQIDPVLAAHGLSYRFRTHQEGAQVFVTCIVSHKSGYSEETTLGGMPDTGAGKNAIQAIGSTTTYLQRYTLKAALGIASAHDDDGRGGPIEPAAQAQQQAPFDPAEWLGRIATARMGGRDAMRTLQGEIRDAIASGAIPKGYHDQLRKAFNQARDSLKNDEPVDAEVVDESA